MMFGFSGFLIVLGILGAASLIIAKKPDAKQLIDKLTPYQGWIGACGALTGAYWTLMAILNLGLLAHSPIGWITWMAVAVVMLLLGFLLGVGTLKTFIKNPEANAKMDQTITKLAPYQGTLGLVSIGLGVWGILSAILFH
jgi:hypothetical protein